MKKLIALAAVTATVLGMIVAGQTPVSAHYRYGYHGEDFASINEDHSYITICDREVDGHAVYVLADFGSFKDTVERDGGDAGCDTLTLLGGLLFADAYVCEEGKGCNRLH